MSRRHARARHLLFSVLAVAIPPRAASLLTSPIPMVAVTVDQFTAVAPRDAYEHIIREAATTYDLEPALIRSVIETESEFDPSAVSSAGASGLMQLMPAVAKSLGVVNLFDPEENIMGGAQLLRELLDRFNGNVPLALASYNAGSAAVLRFGRIPPYPETQAYVKKVTNLLRKSQEAGGG